MARDSKSSQGVALTVSGANYQLGNSEGFKPHPESVSTGDLRIVLCPVIEITNNSHQLVGGAEGAGQREEQ